MLLKALNSVLLASRKSWKPRLSLVVTVIFAARSCALKRSNEMHDGERRNSVQGERYFRTVSGGDCIRQDVCFIFGWVGNKFKRGLKNTDMGLPEGSTRVVYSMERQRTSIPIRTMDLMFGLYSRNASTSGVNILKRVLSYVATCKEPRDSRFTAGSIGPSTVYHMNEDQHFSGGKQIALRFLRCH